MNCFQKLLSSWHDTTRYIAVECIKSLWIAFKNYYLRDTTQLICICSFCRWGCELLSKIIIFVTRHNCSVISNEAIMVVNCFQKLLSSWHDTTWYRYMLKSIWLWIAFKNYYLRDTTQPTRKRSYLIQSCELLSKIIIFVTRHNCSSSSTYHVSVVNCFQKLLSSWHDTTDITII